MITKTCTVSGKEFLLTDWEQAFLKKIAPTFDGEVIDIPLPKISPEERMKQRNIHRNEQYYYHNKSCFSRKQLVSLYEPNSDIKVCSRDEWFSDVWDPIEYGTVFNDEKSFFEQFQDLQKQVPRAATVTLNNENSAFTTGTAYSKNCYLINCSEYCEDCMYSKLLQKCNEVVDTSYAYESELLYQCFDVEKCYECVYLYHSKGCTDCWFGDDLRGCRDCFLCTGLVQKEYHFLNEPCSKEEYERKKEQFFESPAHFQKAREILEDLRIKQSYKYAYSINSEKSSGDFLRNCKECTDCYDVNDGEDCKYVQVGVECKDLLDCSNMYIKPELSYQVLGTIGTFNVHFCLFVFHSSDLWYCEQCFHCKNCFGCVGLRKKEYCIFNKQYLPEDYEKEVARIIHSMKKTGDWGTYFPSFLSPFGYNETVASEYFPLEKKEVLEQRYVWKEEESGAKYDGPKYDIPGDIKDVKDDIIQAILTCEETGKNYRIVKPELDFYRKMRLPIPRICPEARHKQRMDLRNPRKLWDRKCATCSCDIQTTYSPNRPEKVLCEECYLKEVN